MKKKLFLFILIFSIVSLNLSAKSNVWVINKDHSDLLLSIPYMEVSHVNARLRSFTGKIYFNKDNSKKIDQINIQIKAASFDSNHKVRDGHVKGGDFLNTNEYPYISFRSEQVTKMGDHYQAHGQLKIKNKTRLHDINFMITKAIKDSWGHLNRFISFSTIINRQDYGVNWTKGLLGKGELLVGDKITLDANVQIQPLGDKTPMYKHMLPNTEYIKLSEKLHRGEITKEDFEKKVENQATKFPQELKAETATAKSKETPISSPIEVSPTPKEKITPKKIKTPTNPIRRDQVWWFAFTLVSLIGLTTIALSFGLYYESKKESAELSKEATKIFLTKVLASAAIVLIIFFNCLSYLANHGK